MRAASALGVRLRPQAGVRVGLTAPTRVAAASFSILRLQPRHHTPEGPQRLDGLDLRATGSLRTATGAVRGCATDTKPSSPKIDALVEQIASLSLLEASELTEALKVRGAHGARLRCARARNSPACAAGWHHREIRARPPPPVAPPL
eukprot:1757443-Prymnesium_polylepis.1